MTFEQIAEENNKVIRDSNEFSFEVYLKYICFEINQDIENEKEDFFNVWLKSLSYSRLIHFANLFATRCWLEGKQSILKKYSKN